MQVQKVGTHDDIDGEVPSGMFTVVLPCSLCPLRMLPAQGADNDAIIKGLREDVHALKNNCYRLEMLIEELQSRSNTQENTLEGHRQEIVQIKYRQGTLDTNYRGENFDMNLE